jgi:hypothetical protein
VTHLNTWQAIARIALAEGPYVITLVAFTAAPFLLYLLFGRQSTVGTRLTALCCSLVLLYLCAHEAGGSVVTTYFAGFLYFATLAPGVFRLRLLVQSRLVTKPALAMLAAVAFVLVPSVMAPGARYLAIQLTGWELMFAAYSYCVHLPDGDENPTFADCAFFLLVNPALLYGQRGRRVGAPGFSFRAIARGALGVGTLCLHSAVYVALSTWQSNPPALQIASASGYATFMMYYLGRLCGGYFIHSGRASIDIGMMRLAGYEIPERYRYPLFSANPVEFWRRWNTYVGGWFRRYVFNPAAVALQRGRGRRWSTAAKAGAVFTTFLATGLAHDFSVYLRFGVTSFGATLAFMLNAVALLAWAGVGRAAIGTSNRAARAVTGLFGRTAFLHVLALTAWLIIPGMGAGRLPPELSALLTIHS